MARFADMAKAENLMIVDGMNLAFRWKHRGELNFKEDYLRTVESLASSYKAKKVVIVCDHKGSDYRKAILPSYKQNRKDKFEKETEDEKEKSRLFFEEFDRAIQLSSEKYLVLKYMGVEADDLAAFIVCNYSDEFEHTWLISSDRDWDLLIDKTTSRFSYVTRKEISEESWSNHYPYPVYDHLSIKCLMGDSNDNIPGIDGIGPKRAQELVEKYGSALDIYEAIPIEGKYKYIQELNQNKERIHDNYLLMDLVSFHEDAIGQEKIEEIGGALDLYLL